MEMNNTDCLLIEAMQNGSEDAFAVLYRKYSPQLYNNILGMIHDPLLAEEMVQELFSRIWEKRSCKGIREDFTGYMYRIGQNLVHDFFRKLKRDKQMLSSFRNACVETVETPEEVMRRKDLSVALEDAIEKLSPQQKKVYSLVKIEGCTYKKAAEVMGISPFTVKEYLVLTKKTLQKYLLANLDAKAIFIFLTLYFWL